MTGLDALYTEIILDHYRSPHGSGLREPFDAESHQVNPLCGDEITLRVDVDTDAGVVTDVSYEATGCSISQASASMMHDLVAGESVTRVAQRLAGIRQMLLDPDDVEPDEELLEDAIAVAGVARFPARVKCALLPWAAFTDAMARAGVTVRDDQRDPTDQESS